MNNPKKKVKKSGHLFWITGVSGAGKTSVGKKIKKFVQLNFGPTILLNGDDLRDVFKLKGYSRNERLKIGMIYINFLKLIISQNINVIFTVVGLFDQLRIINKKYFKNYHEIYIKANVSKIIKKNKKKTYKKNKKNIWGIDIKPEFPKKPLIIIKNDFTKNIDSISKILINKIKKKLKTDLAI